MDRKDSSVNTLSWRMNDPGKYLEYLLEKAHVDALTRDFYREEKWRSWKFRLFCNRKSSEDRFLDRVERFYGRDCTLYYGDWLRSNQMRGCAPSPTVGMRKILSKKFGIIDVATCAKTDCPVTER